MGRDLTSEKLTTADVLGAIEWAVPALEIVDSRIEGWNIRITDTVADNASSGLFVLGHEVRRLDAIDLRGCGMALECNGELVSSGTGAACLGSPVNAMLWLALVKPATLDSKEKKPSSSAGCLWRSAMPASIGAGRLNGPPR